MRRAVVMMKLWEDRLLFQLSPNDDPENDREKI